MATSGRINTSSSNGSYFYVQWQLAQQDVANNRSLINWQAGLHISGIEYWLLNAVRIDGGNVHTDSIAPGTWSNQSGAGDKQYRSGSVWVNHNSDGSGSFSANINGWLYEYGNRSKSGSWSLPTIPRATTPSFSSSFNIGSSVTISLPRASSSFTHRVEYSFNGQSGTIATAAGTSTTWAVPTSLANTRPNNTSGTGTITVKTYNGNTLIGTKSKGFTANIPNTSTFQPAISGASVSEGEESVASKFSAYVQGRSKVDASFTATGAYGSTITKQSVTIEGKVYPGNDIISDILAGSGTITVTLSATDSRGRTVTSSQNITVLAYAPPAIPLLTAIRTDENGDPDENGEYALITMQGSITSLGDDNTCAYTLRYKKRADSDWTDIDVTPDSGYNLNDTELLEEIDIDSAYDVVLEAADYFTTTSASTNVPTAFTIMDFHVDGQGMSFGKVADTSNRMEIGPKLPLHVIAPTSTEADGGFLRLRRSDDSLLAFIATGEDGTGLNIHMYDGSGWSGKVSIDEDGTINSPSTDAPGVVKMYAGTTAPTGWLVCDGTSLLRADYPKLFAAIGTTWGAADSTHFNLPDMRRRTAVGPGGTGTSTLGNAVGNTGGSETHTLTTAEMPSHTHNLGDSLANLIGGTNGTNNAGITVTGSSYRRTSGNPIQNAGSGNAHNNMQPSAVMNYIIKT